MERPSLRFLLDADCGCGQRPRDGSAFMSCPLWQSVQDMPSCPPRGVRSSEEPATPSAFAAWQFAQSRFCASGERRTSRPPGVNILWRCRFAAGKLVHSPRENSCSGSSECILWHAVHGMARREARSFRFTISDIPPSRNMPWHLRQWSAGFQAALWDSS